MSSIFSAAMSTNDTISAVSTNQYLDGPPAISSWLTHLLWHCQVHHDHRQPKLTAISSRRRRSIRDVNSGWIVGSAADIEPADKASWFLLVVDHSPLSQVWQWLISIHQYSLLRVSIILNYPYVTMNLCESVLTTGNHHKKLPATINHDYPALW